MERISSIEALERLYDEANPLSITKVTDRLTPLYRRWIEASRFVILSTAGPEGTDASPRGDDGPVVRIADDRTLHLPDWRGNNRLDCLRNIVRNPRASLMFMVPGSNNVVRTNGEAMITADEELRAGFGKQGKLPRTVIVFTIAEMYFQCAKALMRSRLWTAGDESALVPTAGEFLREVQAGFDAQTYDAEYPQRAPGQFW